MFTSFLRGLNLHSRGEKARVYKYILPASKSQAATNVTPTTTAPLSTTPTPAIAAPSSYKGSASQRALDMKHFYTDFPLHRAQELRTDKAKVQELYTAESTVLIPSHGGKFLVMKTEGTSVPFMLRNPGGFGPDLLVPGAVTIFLGIDPLTKAAVFTAEVRDAAAPWVPQGAQWANARSEGPMMSEKDAALLATASGLTSFHSKNKFCGRCGGVMGPKNGGHAVECLGHPAALPEPKPSCRNSVFPRNDPATITLVTCGDWLLLGRKAEWTPGRYSLLAGFVELGESLEQGVAREIQEESGVAIDPSSVAYHSSQPWPFPQSLMIGMEAEAVWQDPRKSTQNPARPPTSMGEGEEDPTLAFLGQGKQELRDAIRAQGLSSQEVLSTLLPDLYLPKPAPEEDELEDVRWFHRDFLKATIIDQKTLPGAEVTMGGVNGRFNIPGEYSLAGKAIKEWILRDGACAPWDGDVFADALIDSGVFKYVLMRLSDEKTGRSKLLVHGSVHASYHDNVYQTVLVPAVRRGLNCEVLGGGRIEHVPGTLCSVYGYSQAFGAAPHEMSAAILKRWYPFCGTFNTSYEGY